MRACDTPVNLPGAIADWYRSAFESYFRLWSAALPAASSQCGPCEIPETSCPPRCECTLEWETCEDKAVSGTLAVHNTGRTPVKFHLAGTVFRSACSATDVVPQLTPASFDLAPGEHQSVKVTVAPNATFEPDSDYASTVTVTGRYAEKVHLRLRVHAADSPCCAIDHGEIPRRIRAHHWFDHFQCEQLCFEPVGQTRQPAPKR